MVYIRRVRLDMLGRTSDRTVATNKSNIQKGTRIIRELDINPSFPNLGPYSLSDNVDFSVALKMFIKIARKVYGQSSTI